MICSKIFIAQKHKNMKFPANLNGTSHAKNIARSILALNSICKPSSGSLAKPATTNPVAPLVPAVAATSGVNGFKDAFRLIPTTTGTDLVAELPYSPKAYAASLDLASAIRDVPGTAAVLPVIKPLVTPAALAMPVSLEAYLYAEMVAASAIVSTAFDPINNRPFVLCKLSVADDVATLLTESSGGGGAEP
jgi:hypothetical protein